jgi:hypothetical protein
LSREVRVAHAAHDNARLDQIYNRFRAVGLIDTSLIVLTSIVMVLKLGA